MSKFSRIKTAFLRTNKKINFEFNGKKYSGFYGDTLASALLANNVILIARSFKYHRPRGIISSGSHEPNALVGAKPARAKCAEASSNVVLAE